jgi:uncharacterized protein (DUF2461 family)
VGELKRAVAVASDAGLSLVEPELTRAPRGYPADHPELDLLRCKSLTVSRRQDLRGWVHKPEAGRRVRGLVEGATPLVSWLRERVGPPQEQRSR